MGVFDEEGFFCVETLSKVREVLEKSKSGDGSVLRRHAKGGMHGWVAERMVRCAEKMVGRRGAEAGSELLYTLLELLDLR